MPNEEESHRSTKPADLELVITRTFDAPRELVFEAFTNPAHLTKWWGPRGCTVVACETDPKAGGTWSISMRSPKVLPGFDNRYPVETIRGPSTLHPVAPGDTARDQEWIVERQRGTYREVVKPERLVFTYAFEDSAGQILHQTVVTIRLADEQGRTRLTLHQATFDTISNRDGHVRGWTEALDDLAKYLMPVR